MVTPKSAFNHTEAPETPPGNIEAAGFIDTAPMLQGLEVDVHDIVTDEAPALELPAPHMELFMV